MQKVHSFVPKTNKILKLRNDDDLSYNHARQAESRGIAQTMESRVRYGTHTRLPVVLYTSRVQLIAANHQSGWMMIQRGEQVFF